MVQAGGLEPPAYFLGGSRSILMSYACNVSRIYKTICIKTQEYFKCPKKLLQFTLITL